MTSGAELRALVERLGAVPDEMRSLTVGPRLAASMYGLDADLVGRAAAAGLTHRRDGDDVLIDETDAANLGLWLGLRSVQARTFQSWRRTLEEATDVEGGVATFDLEYTATCEQRHRGACEYLFTRPPGLAQHVVSSTPAMRAGPFRVERPTIWPAIPSAVETVVAAMADLDFFVLPSALGTDPAFADRHRMAGCGLAAHMLHERLRAASIPAHLRYGLLLVAPFATPHNWVEVDVDGVPVPVDPHLINLLVRFTGLPATAWPSSRSPGAIFAPLDGASSVGEHVGEAPALPVTVVTKLAVHGA